MSTRSTPEINEAFLKGQPITDTELSALAFSYRNIYNGLSSLADPRYKLFANDVNAQMDRLQEMHDARKKKG